MKWFRIPDTGFLFGERPEVFANPEFLHVKDTGLGNGESVYAPMICFTPTYCYANYVIITLILGELNLNRPPLMLRLCDFSRIFSQRGILYIGPAAKTRPPTPVVYPDS
jgi:hypothetical protein